MGTQPTPVLANTVAVNTTLMRALTGMPPLAVRSLPNPAQPAGAKMDGRKGVDRSHP
jgi:hypothetical protein